jgi:hypothetical protein
MKMERMLRGSLNSSLVLVVGTAALIGCGDAGGPTPALSLSFATKAPLAASARRGPSFSVAADTFVSGANTLIITKAQIVLRDIKLKKQEVADCDVEPEPAGCESFKTGPILLDLPVTAGATPQVTIDIPVGTYTRVEFKVHKVSDSDTAFLAANPTFAGKSIHVEGTFNGTPFTFDTDLDVEQKMELTTPLVIGDATTSTNLTVRVDLATWFKTAAGALIDPSTANNGGQNKGLVTENIQHSMKVFKDKEKDGGDDDDGNH